MADVGRNCGTVPGVLHRAWGGLPVGKSILAEEHCGGRGAVSDAGFRCGGCAVCSQHHETKGGACSGKGFFQSVDCD